MKNGSVSRKRFTAYCLAGLLSTALCMCSNSELWAQAVAVKNVRFVQDEEGVVVVYYDLLGNPDKDYTVVLSLYIPALNRMFGLNGKRVFGAVGPDIRPGRDLIIEWDLLADMPGGLHGDNFVFVVDAYAQKGGSNLPVILGILAAAGGGTAFLFLNSGSSAGPFIGPDLPGPPDLPGSP